MPRAVVDVGFGDLVDGSVGDVGPEVSDFCNWLLFKELFGQESGGSIRYEGGCDVSVGYWATEVLGMVDMIRVKRRSTKRSLTAASLAGILIAVSLTLTGSPAAAHSEAEAIAACGSGYRLVSDGKREVRTGAGTVYGYVYLTYNSGNGYNCVVTRKTRFHGTSTWTEAWLLVEGQSWRSDYGNFLHYAGPPKLRVSAAGRCVQYFGRIYSGTNQTGTLAQGGRLTWGNCG